MTTSKPNPDSPRAAAGERVFNGTAVSRGTAVGTAVTLFGIQRQFFRVDIPPAALDAELQRFDNAVADALAQLESLSSSSPELPTSASAILDFHQLILTDIEFTGEVKSFIKDQRVNVEWALKRKTEQRSIGVRAFQFDKNIDLIDVVERVLVSLGGNIESLPQLAKDAVIVASVVKPSTLIELGLQRPVAIVTEHGGWTSHAFIMAREMKIPAITGIRNAKSLIAHGSTVLVDGYNGQAVVEPSAETVDQMSGRASAVKFLDGDGPKPTQRCKTLDGREIVIRVNGEGRDTEAGDADTGTEGVGLLRSEYLFSKPVVGLPSEEDQYTAYSRVSRAAGDGGVRIRTFDLHAEQIALEHRSRESNPALGLRAIRLSLKRENLFREQLRAILRASQHGNVSIVIPMVSGISEIARTKAILGEERELLQHRGLTLDGVELGVMIEVPSAVLTIDDIVNEVDFMCLGTNDLVQYIIAVDRDNESVAEFYQSLHPAVIKAISLVIMAAAASGKPLTVCGEMAGSIFYTPLLIGLGANEFSMNMTSIAEVSRVVQGISFDEAFAFAAEVQRSTDGADTEAFLRNHYLEHWPHLFPESFFRLKK